MAITVVQAAQNINATEFQTSVTVTFGSATTAGNCVVAVIGGRVNGYSGLSLTLGGSAGNFSKLTDVSILSGAAFLAAWADPSCAGGQTTVTATLNGGDQIISSMMIEVYEVSGVASAGVLDQSGTASGGNISSISVSTGTTATASEFWCGAVWAETSSPPLSGPSSPWANQPAMNIGGGNSIWMVSGSEIASSTGAATYSGTPAASGSFIQAMALVVTLQPAGAFQVTATESDYGGTAGVSLQVLVLTGASGQLGQVAKTSNGGTNEGGNNWLYQLGLTPEFTGSLLVGNFGMTINAAGGSMVSGTTRYSVVTAPFSHQYSLYSSSATTGGSPQSLGFTLTATNGWTNTLVLAEFAGSSIAIDASTPPGVTASASPTTTTGSFLPPAGAILAALTGAYNDTGLSNLVMSVTDTSGGRYAWQQVALQFANEQYSDLWIGLPVPAYGALRSPVHAPFQVPTRAGRAYRTPPYVSPVNPPPPTAITGPYFATLAQDRWGAQLAPPRWGSQAGVPEQWDAEVGQP